MISRLCGEHGGLIPPDTPSRAVSPLTSQSWQRKEAVKHGPLQKFSFILKRHNLLLFSKIRRVYVVTYLIDIASQNKVADKMKAESSDTQL